MLGFTGLLRQRRADGVARQVGLNMAERLRPGKNRLDPAPQPARRCVLIGPQRNQYVKNVRPVDQIDPLMTDMREDISAHGPQPVLFSLATAPCPSQGVQRFQCRRFEGGYNGLALFRQRIPAGVDQPPVEKRRLPGLVHTHDGKRTQAQIVALAFNRDSLYPVFAPVRDSQIQCCVHRMETGGA